jgi:hypothetical protein
MTASDQEIAVHRSVTVPLPRESALAARFARGRFRPEQVNAVGVAELRGCSPRELLDRLHDHQEPRGLTAGFGGRVALVDGMIHSRTSAVRWAGCGRSRRTGCSRLCRSRGSLHRSARSGEPVASGWAPPTSAGAPGAALSCAGRPSRSSWRWPGGAGWRTS